MTLDELANAVCAKARIIDADTIALCQTFGTYRFRDIYNSFPWRDAQVTEAAQTVADQSYIPTPSTIERVLSIRYSDDFGSPGLNDRFLDPTDSTFQVESNPSIFNQTGAPLYYEEYSDLASNERRIRFFPTPAITGDLLIIGKQPCPVLSSTDSPTIRNIENALMGFMMADLLKSQRQYGKAAQELKEAQDLLQLAQSVENGQANRPRQSKSLTVAGNSLSEMLDAVCACTGAWSLDNRILIREYLRRNYQMVYDSYLWSESTVLHQVASDGAQVILAEYVGRVIAVRANSTLLSLFTADVSYFFGINPGVFEQTGDPVVFSLSTPVAVKILPTQNEKLILESTSTKDAGVRTFVKGETLGYEVSEMPVLPATTQYTYDTPLTISKPVTDGDMTVTGETTGTLYQRILAGERERKHIRLWLQPNSLVPIDCLILGKRNIKPLVTDEDTPLLRDIQNVLINAAAADMFSKMGNKDGATDARAKADAALKTLMELEKNQSAHRSRIIPDAEPICDGINDSGWLVKSI